MSITYDYIESGYISTAAYPMAWDNAGLAVSAGDQLIMLAHRQLGAGSSSWNRIDDFGSDAWTMIDPNVFYVKLTSGHAAGSVSGTLYSSVTSTASKGWWTLIKVTDAHDLDTTDDVGANVGFVFSGTTAFNAPLGRTADPTELGIGMCSLDITTTGGTDPTISDGGNFDVFSSDEQVYSGRDASFAWGILDAGENQADFTIPAHAGTLQPIRYIISFREPDPDPLYGLNTYVAIQYPTTP